MNLKQAFSQRMSAYCGSMMLITPVSSVRVTMVRPTMSLRRTTRPSRQSLGWLGCNCRYSSIFQTWRKVRGRGTGLILLLDYLAVLVYSLQRGLNCIGFDIIQSPAFDQVAWRKESHDCTHINLVWVSVQRSRCLFPIIFYIYLMKSQEEEESHLNSSACRSQPVLLIYYNFRGIGQIVRYLLCYLQVPYFDILLDQYQKQRETLPQQVTLLLRSKSINRNDLPAIMHNGHIIYELNQVMNYLCLHFNREDLLGWDIYQKARICEVQELYSTKLAGNIRFLSGFVAEVHQTSLTQQALLGFIEGKLEMFFKQAGYFKELSQYLLRQEQQRFVFGNLTVIDFYYIQTSKFAVGLFSNIDDRICQPAWIEPARSYRQLKQSRGQRVKNVQNLRAMKRFIEFITAQPFYLKNQPYFQSFKQFPKSITGQQQQGMKKLQTNYFLDLYYNG